MSVAGAKEIDIAATLEHLRDQRPGMVQTKVRRPGLGLGVGAHEGGFLKRSEGQAGRLPPTPAPLRRSGQLWLQPQRSSLSRCGRTSGPGTLRVPMGGAGEQ